MIDVIIILFTPQPDPFAQYYSSGRSKAIMGIFTFIGFMEDFSLIFCNFAWGEKFL